jgi:hypothetical protein
LIDNGKQRDSLDRLGNRRKDRCAGWFLYDGRCRRGKCLTNIGTEGKIIRPEAIKATDDLRTVADTNPTGGRSRKKCHQVICFLGVRGMDPLMTQPARPKIRMSVSESGPTGRITLCRPLARPNQRNFFADAQLQPRFRIPPPLKSPESRCLKLV